jgi:glycosyltransferase involved in cell wall biosynthesis
MIARRNMGNSELRIGYFVETQASDGGVFQQTLSSIIALSDAMPDYEVVVLTPHADNVRALRNAGVKAELYAAGWRGKLDSVQALSLVADQVLHVLRKLGLHDLGRNLDRRLSELGVDIGIFGNATTAMRLADHPYVMTVWDLCHLDLPYSPGVSLGREFERREYCFRIVLPKAVAVIANCPSHVERIAEIYHVDRKRIIMLPFLPSVPVRRHAEGKGTVTAKDVRAKYNLTDDYVFYPAQFCAEKNHVYVLDALVALETKYGRRLNLALCGSDTGNRAHVEDYVRRLGLVDRVHFLGFVPDEEVPALYQGALALTIPTDAGPTNLPPLEAAALGCPVIYSDLPEWRDFMGDAALYCDLKDPQSMADHLHALLTDASLVERLQTAGRRRAVETGENLYAECLKPVMKDFAYKRRRWAR